MRSAGTTIAAIAICKSQFLRSPAMRRTLTSGIAVNAYQSDARHHTHVMARPRAQLPVDRAICPTSSSMEWRRWQQKIPRVPRISPHLQVLNLDHLVADLRSARRAARQAGTQPVRTRDLPSTSAVESIVQRLHATLFPRHRGAHDDVEAGVDYFVGYNLTEALRELGEQVRRELRFTNVQSDARPSRPPQSRSSRASPASCRASTRCSPAISARPMTAIPRPKASRRCCSAFRASRR